MQTFYVLKWLHIGVFEILQILNNLTSGSVDNFEGSTMELFTIEPLFKLNCFNPSIPGPMAKIAYWRSSMGSSSAHVSHSG